jgi:NAD(P)-dependent dehydrogenase (short-subunit alcohol dehydrogenase family)
MDMSGKVALIVGGTRGIGKETARALAASGATTVIVGRNRETGEAAARELGDRVEFIAADISLLSEVRRLAEQFRSKHSRLDVLVHTADVLRTKREDTAEGLEVCFATNYLSRFLLNELLLDLLERSAPARIVHVALAGMPGKLDLRNVPPRPELSSFSAHTVGQRANDIYGVELATRLQGRGVTINIMNPGIVDTDIRRSLPSGRKLLVRLLELVLRPMTLEPSESARQVMRLATAPALEGVSGRLFGPKGRELRLRRSVSDRERRQRLWELSERLIQDRARPPSFTGGLAEA